jgi:hypothetical protein
MRRVLGWLAVWVLPPAAIAGSAVPLVMYWDRYPDPLAVHWGVSGEPNGTLPLWLYAVGVFGGMALAWWGLISGTRRGPNAPLAAVVYFIIGLLAAVNAQILYFNLDAVSWREARHLDVLTFGGILLIGVLAGGLGWLLEGGKGGVPENVELEMTTATSWAGSASNLWLASIAVIPVGFAFVVDPVWSALLIAIAILALVFAFVRVDAAADGVTISLGPVGFPRRKLSWDTITGAGAIDVQAIAYGGWGWRIRRGRRAYIIRGGPAIRMERAKGVATIVTVDGAPEGAAVIEGLARARRYG